MVSHSWLQVKQRIMQPDGHIGWLRTGGGVTVEVFGAGLMDQVQPQPLPREAASRRASCGICRSPCFGDAQFNFSPAGATREIEDYAVDMREVSRVELAIVPDICHRTVAASLTSLQIT
jgi:hypothetical protein